MSEEQLKAFVEKVKGDASLKQKLNDAGDADAVFAIAKEAGFMISADDLENAQSEVSDAELEGAAGGIICTYISAIELISKAGGTCRKNLPLGF